MRPQLSSFWTNPANELYATDGAPLKTKEYEGFLKLMET